MEGSLAVLEAVVAVPMAVKAVTASALQAVFGAVVPVAVAAPGRKLAVRADLAAVAAVAVEKRPVVMAVLGDKVASAAEMGARVVAQPARVVVAVQVSVGLCLSRPARSH